MLKNKKTIKLNESQLHNLIKESVKKVLKENFDQFSDSDFASEDPYTSFGERTDDETSLDGIYGSYNNIEVKIEGDNTDNPVIIVKEKYGRNQKTIQGQEAQEILAKIKQDAEEYDTNAAIYMNLHNYVI